MNFIKTVSISPQPSNLTCIEFNKERPTLLKSKRSFKLVMTTGYTNRVYRNKMGVDMTWLRSLPNFQHHLILTHDTTTLRPPPLHPRRMHLHLNSHLACQNALPNQEEVPLQQRALLIGCDSQAWRACGPTASASPGCI